MPKYDVVRIENRSGGHSEHLGEINAPTLESAQDRASVEYECPKSCQLIVSESTDQEAKAKHTPGPWVIQHQGPDFWIDVPCDAPKHRQDVCRLSYGNPDGKANARLIAAAPELLEALEELVNRVDTTLHAGYVGINRIVKARDAIRKARGE